MTSPPSYDADGYWSDRLDRNFNLRGTGHLAYSETYNRWLYRAKGRALRRALNGVPPSAFALDIGSGVGWVVAQLRERGHAVEGCDISAGAVSRLSEQHPDLTFFELTVGATPVPRPDATYGLVTMLDVAYHVTDDEQWRAGLQELGRVLRPGGFVVVTDVLGAEVETPAPHVRFRTMAQWQDAGAAAGLEFDRVGVLYRWLSRDRHATTLSRLPDGAHGAMAYLLDRVTPRAPQMRWARFRRST